MPRLCPQHMPVARNPGFWSRTWTWMRSKRQWQLIEDWRFTLPDGTLVVIPAGFTFDGASAPRLFWPFMPPVGPLLIPALVHDFAYRFGHLWTPDNEGGYREYGKHADRSFWDRLFHQIGMDLVGPMLFTLPAGRVMQLTGWIAWNRHRRANLAAPHPYT